MQNQFPSISLNSIQLAEINDLEVGATCKLEITVQLTGLRKAESYDIPTQDIGEGSMPQNSVMVGTFDIIDVEKYEEEEENDPKSFEEEFADKMEQAYKNDNVTILIKKN